MRVDLLDGSCEYVEVHTHWRAAWDSDKKHLDVDLVSSEEEILAAINETVVMTAGGAIVQLLRGLKRVARKLVQKENLC